MFAITGPGLQNAQQTALTPHLNNLRMTLSAPRTIQKELPFFLHHIETKFLYNFRRVELFSHWGWMAPSHLLRKQVIGSVLQKSQRKKFPHCTNQNKITLHAAPYKTKQNLPLRASAAALGTQPRLWKLWICSPSIGDLQKNTLLSHALFFSSFEYNMSLCKASL